MTNQRPADLESRPVVDWLAGHIQSPEQRLRFLRVVMASRPSSRPPRRSYEFWVLITCVVVALLVEMPSRTVWANASKALRHPSSAAMPLRAAVVHVGQAPKIWRVEGTDDFETYSNGLRIDNRFAVANHPRSYLVYSATQTEDTRGELRSVPAGIVFHTTESRQAPFEPEHNSALKRIGQSLLTSVRLKRSYNFLIDRFGRVYRVVLETDAANHAGNSVWADAQYLYLGLNESFIGVSFETETLPGQIEATVNPAQVSSAAMLTEMLRQRYGIPAGNCITHAQVSVNISNQLIGYHTDWASSFPFDQLGLPDNYAIPSPAVSVFGFEYDPVFVHQAGVRLCQGVQLAEQVLREHAAAAHMALPAYRSALQKAYWTRLKSTRGDATGMDLEE